MQRVKGYVSKELLRLVEYCRALGSIIKKIKISKLGLVVVRIE
jgi:hypothetical protein